MSESIIGYTDTLASKGKTAGGDSETDEQDEAVGEGDDDEGPPDAQQADAHNMNPLSTTSTHADGNTTTQKASPMPAHWNPSCHRSKYKSPMRQPVRKRLRNT